MSVYRVFITKEILVDSESWEEACEEALDDGAGVIMTEEYLNDELNGESGGLEK